MKTYRVHIPAAMSAFTTVQAEDEESAIEGADPPSLCSQCSGFMKDAGFDYDSDGLNWDEAEAVEVES